MTREDIKYLSAKTHYRQDAKEAKEAKDAGGNDG
jgi:hypothetical protein